MLKFQAKIVGFFNEYTVNTLPKSIILQGQMGSGRRTLIRELCERLNIKIEEVNHQITIDDVFDYSTRLDKTMYIFHGDTMSVQSQNAILKFLEEPSENVFITILCENLFSLLFTVRSRCCYYDMHMYSMDELRTFTDDEDLLSIADTPGDIEKLKGYNIGEYKTLATKIIFNINRASLSNILTLSKKISFSDDDKKLLPLFYFLKLMKNEAYNAYKNSGDYKFARFFYLISGTKQDLLTPQVNQKQCFENLLSAMHTEGK